ncbi:protease modulator HflK N-terminal domain-containing protein, partial [Citrobacter sp.]
MAWNQPGNNGQDRDPWGSSKPGGNPEGNGNKGGRDQGPPDLDDIFRKLSKKLGGLGGGKGTGSGGGSSSQGPRPQLGGRVFTIAAAAIVIIWAASGFYTIKEAERGVVTRFGKFSH